MNATTQKRQTKPATTAAKTPTQQEQVDALMKRLEEAEAKADKMEKIAKATAGKSSWTDRFLGLLEAGELDTESAMEWLDNKDNNVPKSVPRARWVAVAALVERVRS